MDLEWLRELADRHRYKVLGSLGGLVFALMVVRFGFFWVLFIVVCAGLGYWIGKRIDEDPEGLVRLLDRMIPPGGR